MSKFENVLPWIILTAVIYALILSNFNYQRCIQNNGIYAMSRSGMDICVPILED